MANLEITVPLTYEITETSKAVLKTLIAETLRESGATVFPDEMALRAFIREEVRKVLRDDLHRARMVRHGNGQ